MPVDPTIRAALRDAGFAVVPREPTNAMLRAICRRRGIDPDAKVTGVLDNVSIETMAGSVADYRAMIAAAEETDNAS